MDKITVLTWFPCRSLWPELCQLIVGRGRPPEDLQVSTRAELMRDTMMPPVTSESPPS